MSNPKLSVIVPIYKIEKYLPDCVESLLQQSFYDFELVLVDDGSPDNCPEICDEYAKLDSRVKVVHKENGGLLSARKAGLENSNGKYIAFVDGDDWVDKFYLDTLYKLAVINDADLVVTGHFREFDGKIEIFKPKTADIYEEKEIKSLIIPKAIYNDEFCAHGVSTYVWNKLFKKELLASVLVDVPNEIIMGEDAAITYSYLAITKKLVISRIPLCYYRQRHDSIVKSIENPETEFYRLGILMNFLKIKLSEVLDAENLNKQIKYYLYSQILVRSGGLILNKSNEVIHNPFISVKEGSKVVIYSSGSFGQHILATNLKSKFVNIVKWIDVDFHDMKIGNCVVEPISSIKNDIFDHLIIATINPSTHKSIQQELILMGIDKTKFTQINTDETVIDSLLLNLGFNENFIYKNHLS